jgi:hypothetical protein
LGSDPSSLEDYRFAVAVHEAGHAVVGAYLRFDIREIHLGSIGGHAEAAADTVERTGWLVYWIAGEVAVEEICGGHRLPVDTNPNSDHKRLRQVWGSKITSSVDLRRGRA